MSIAQLISALLNLGQETDFWNSSAAARDFWIVFGVAVVIAIAAMAIRSTRDSRPPRLRHH
jgi:hypothetical protein